MAGSQYNFPLLEAAQLVDHYNNRFPELNLVEQDIKEPSAERWQQIYSIILHQMLNVSVDQLLQLPPNVDVPYPEIQKTAIDMLMLAMRRIMLSAKVEDFAMVDVIRPSTKRIKKHMSGLINFIVFFDDRMDFVTKLEDDQNAVLARRDQLVQEIEEKERRINNLRIQKSEQEPEIQQIQEAIGHLSSKMEVHKGDMSALDKRKEAVKANRAELKKRVAHLQERIASSKEENVQLSEQIVQSPERFKGDTEGMKNQLEQLKSSTHDSRSRLMTMQEKRKAVQQQTADFKQAIKLVAACISEEGKDHAAKSANQDVLEQIGEKREVLRQLETEEQQLKRQVASKQERLTKINLQHKHNTASQQEEIQQLRQQLDFHDQKSKEKDSQKREIVKMIRQVREAQSQQQDQQDKSMTGLKEKYSQLLLQVEAYHGQLASTWEEQYSQLRNIVGPLGVEHDLKE